jgi:hypothetical protein
VDKFDHLIAARSGFKGKDLVEFNKGTSKAQARGAGSGLETSSYLIPIPLAAAYKATRVGYSAAKNWKMLRHADWIGDAAAAKSKLDFPATHQVVSAVGKTLGKLGKLQEQMLKAGHSVFEVSRHPMGPPKDFARRATQIVSEAADKLVSMRAPHWARPGTKISNVVIGPARQRLREFAEFHNTAKGVGSMNQLFNNIINKPINTAAWERTRKALGKLDTIYRESSSGGVAWNVGTSAPILFSRYQLMREHLYKDTAMGEAYKRGTEKHAAK